MDMNDYSGAFRPDLRMTDFSREALDHFERHGVEELARPLNMPPRSSKAEPACQWEFRVEDLP